MARKNANRFAQYYTGGNTALRIEEPKPRPQKPAHKPRPRRQKAVVLRVDLVAVAGLLVAGALLLMMVFGAAGLIRANREVARLENSLSILQEENAQLQKVYHSGYDIEEIRQQALEMGMIPADEAKVIPIQVVPEATEEETPLNSFWAFLMGLFA